MRLREPGGGEVGSHVNRQEEEKVVKGEGQECKICLYLFCCTSQTLASCSTAERNDAHMRPQNKIFVWIIFL